MVGFTNRSDGAHYYAETLIPPQPAGPRVHRSDVSGAAAQDYTWNVEVRDWVPTKAVWAYAFGHGDNTLEEITEAEAVRLIEQRQRFHDARAGDKERGTRDGGVA